MTKAISKICKYYLLMNLFCMAVFTNKNAYTVFASEGNPYPHSYTEYDEEGHEIYHPGNCTWQAWEECYNRLGIKLPSWGNGGTWHSSVEQAGYSYTEWETGSHYENCLVEWNHHVAWLISCDENGANIAEGNLRQDGEYRERVEKWWSWNDLKNRWGDGTPYIIFLNAPETEEPPEEEVHEFDAYTVDTEITEVTEDEYEVTEEDNGEQVTEINEEEQPAEEIASELDVQMNEMPEFPDVGTDQQETTEESEEQPLTQTDIFKQDTHSLLMEGADVTEPVTEENIEEEIQSPLDMQKAETLELLTEGVVEPEALEQGDIEEEQPVTETDQRKAEMLSLLMEGVDVVETETEENIEEETLSPLDMQKAETLELLAEGIVEPEDLEQENIEEEQPVTETDPRKAEMLSLLKEGFDEEKYLKKIADEEALELERKEMLLKYNDLFVEEPEEIKGVLEYEIPSGGSCFVTKREMVE